jgi:hypothetical protein
MKRENHSGELQKMCYLCRYLWIRKAFTVVVFSKSSEPSFPEIIKPSYGVEFQAAPATSQKKGQLICGR